MVDVHDRATDPHLLEAGVQQRTLHAGGIRHEEIDVAERSQRGVRVVPGDVRAFQEDDVALDCRTDALEQDGRCKHADSRATLLLDELLRHLTTL